MRTWMIIGISLLLGGCVGVTFINPEVLEKPPYLKAEQGQISHKKQEYSQFDVLSLWGDPKEKYMKNDLEHWVYNRELAWAGGVLYLLIPIPLMIPIGNRETTIIFEGDNAVNALYEIGRSQIYACGPLIPLADGVDSTIGWCGKGKSL